MRKNYLLIAWLCFVFGLQAQISVDDSRYSIQELVEDILIASPCIQTSNYSSFTGTVQGINGIGYFEKQSSDFPFLNGVVLSTGKVSDAPGPNENPYTNSGTSQWVGDNDLESITDTDGTHNASYIEFTFTPIANKISFNFIFASEEYTQSDWECKFSDVFAFILTDSYNVSRNLAVIPGTNTPIKVTTVHGPLPGGECPPQNESYFDTYNDPILSAIEYNGQTVPLKAEADVIPGETYTIKLVIADNGDAQMDSAVFLEAGSFVIDGSLGPDRTIANGTAGCDGSSLILDSGTVGTGSFVWKKDGTVISGENGSTLEVAGPGTYEVDFVLDSGCSGGDSILVEFADAPQVQTPDIFTMCEIDGDGTENFNLTSLSSAINSETGTQITYFESITDVNADTPIVNANNYTNKTNPQIVIARVTSSYGCSTLVDVVLRVSSFPAINFSPDPIEICDDNSDGMYVFDLTQRESEIRNGFTGIDLRYFTTRSGAAENRISDEIVNTVSFQNTTAFHQTIYIRATDPAANCYNILTLSLVVHTLPGSVLQTSYSLCLDANNMPVADAPVMDTGLDTSQYNFAWYTGTNPVSTNLIMGATEASYTTAVQGPYGVLVTNRNTQCQRFYKTELIPSYPAEDFTAVVTTRAFSGSQVIEASVVGNGAYVFSLDGGTPQESGVFRDVAPGEHWVTVSDTLGCGSMTISVMVIDFPRFFTPNGDGTNDSWDIFEGLDVPDDTVVYIYDKFGKLLKQLTRHTKGWDGTFNGIYLPSSDYWFNIVFEEDNVRKEIKGHFSLKR